MGQGKKIEIVKGFMENGWPFNSPEEMGKKERFIVMRAKGWSYDKIASELGICLSTAKNWAKDLQEDIRNLKVIEKDKLIRRYILSKEKRMEFLGQLLDKINTELSERDLKGASDYALVTMAIKLISIIRKGRGNIKV